MGLYYRSMCAGLCVIFLNGEPLLPDFNDTVLVLVPRVNSPELMTQFHLFSLCALQDIIQVLANRLKEILTILISEKQSAFVRRRLITDNVFIAYERIHSLRFYVQKRIARRKTEHLLNSWFILI
jgi:hypothetical protein